MEECGTASLNEREVFRISIRLMAPVTLKGIVIILEVLKRVFEMQEILHVPDFFFFGHATDNDV
jgi:hypothetical protein